MYGNPEWELVDQGNVAIGPGSYYTSDKLITLIDRGVTDEAKANTKTVQKTEASTIQLSCGKSCRIVVSWLTACVYGPKLRR
jgi:hypothetical protein